MSKFGITAAIYFDMLEEQGGVCYICQGPEIGGRRLAVDHCHYTGKVRGLLCARCNRAIGMLEDSLELVERAAEYLRKYA